MSIRIAGQVVASAGSLTAHNEDPNAHPDIRELIGQGGGGGGSGGGYSKEEIDNKFTVVDTAILGNAEAIQKTRSDFMESDSELQQQINAHANEIATLKNDTDELGDQVSEIESKIPEGTNDTNPLINKQQLLDEEMSLREDMMETDSELQTQINALAEAIQGGGGGGGGSVPDNVYTSDNLVGGENISFAKESSYDANTISLYHFEGNSNDEITGGKMLNDSALSGAESKFGTGSLGLIEDTISVGALSKTINPKTTSFTMEFWHKFVAGTTSGRYGEETSIAFMPTEQTDPGWKTNWIGMYMLPDGNYNTIKIQVGESRLGSFDTSTLTTVGAWNHYAFVWDVATTTFKIYMNGKLGGTYEYGSTDWLETFGYIGAFKYTTGSESLTTARMYIDELRVSDTIRYTGEFEVATKAFEGSEAKTKVNAVLPEGIYTKTNLLDGKDIEIVPEPVEGGIDEYTLACWHFDDADGTQGNNSLDSVSGMGYPDGNTNGNRVRIAAAKFGAAGLQSSYQKHKDFSLASEDEWTIDCWWKPLSQGAVFVAGIGEIISSYQRPRYYHVTFDSAKTRNKIYVSPNHTSSYGGNVKEVDANFVVNQYYHIAAQKNKNGVISAYVDGVKVIEYEGDVRNESPYLGFGSNYGHIDELRISKVARYTDDFEPPTEPYQLAEPTGNMVINFTGKSGGAFDFQGTEAEFNAAVEAGQITDDTVSLVTDDNSGELVATKAELAAVDSSKADTALSNVLANIDYVVESKTPTADDPTWYRKYKSGWLEQGGTVGLGNNGEYFINFPKPFADTQYTILKTNNWYLTTNATFQWTNIWGKTTTSATTYSAQQSTGGVGFSWHAYGQGA